MIINGVDFSGARERPKAPIPLWQACVEFPDDGPACLTQLRQLASREQLLRLILTSSADWLWGIDAPFGIPKAIVPADIDLTQPLWSVDNFRIFQEQQDSIPTGGHKRQTDGHNRGTAGPFSMQLRPMTCAAISLLHTAQIQTDGGLGVFPWDANGRVLEVFPGAAAVALDIGGVSTNSYKKHAKSLIAIEQRRATIGGLIEGAAGVFPPLLLSDEYRDFCIGSDDALDAVLAALCAYWHTQHLKRALSLRRQAECAWPVEGMIAGPSHDE